jgi:Fe-S-cluster-containing dehydrogenase component/CRP-like cAMP-binding protein
MTDNIVKRPKRWDQPFDDSLQVEDVVKIFSGPHFRSMDRSNFPDSLKLIDIVRNDCRLKSFKKGQLIVRSGEYVNSAFIVQSGEVALLSAADLPPGLWGQTKRQEPSVGHSLWRWLRRNRLPEVRASVSADASSIAVRHVPSKESLGGIVVDDICQLLKTEGNEPEFLGEGDLFGESAVLGRNEMTHSAVALNDTVILEVRWQGLRDIRKREAGFREFIDKVYRQRGLYTHLLSVPLFNHLPVEKIRELSEVALFEVYGEFEWQSHFQTVSKQADTDDDYNKLIDSEPVVALEGDYPDGLLLVRNGFGRVSRYINHGHYTLGYIGSGGMFGLSELYDAWKQGRDAALNCSFRALGYTDVIRVPTQWLEDNIFSMSAPEQVKSKLRKALEGHYSIAPSAESKPVDRKLTEFLVENRFINGSSSMVIDLERCVRCDDCVSACSNAHDNNPRFVRHGKNFGRYMIANACMHCEDPVCMIGCPTGAIHRSSDGVVKINDVTCIGCSTCANNCPYDNINMVSVRDTSGKIYTDAATKPIIKASKCDLCSDTAGAPACERACSHDALTRIDLKDITGLANWVDR